jgi:hypothetical protein
MLAVAFCVVLGHVCVLPHEAEAANADERADHGSHDGHSEHDALHAASCEAVTPNVMSSASALEAAASLVPATSDVPVAILTHARRSGASATSPPLFLLHSALRI